MATTRPQLLNQFGDPLRQANGHSRLDLVEALVQRNDEMPYRRTRASYDAARDSHEYSRHWQWADAKDADAANSREVRHKLIRRSRYEEGSNGYFDGTINTYCNMLVGTGPHLRCKTDNRQFNQAVEEAFHDWALRVELRRKLWCMAHARIMDGESFALFANNPDLDELDVQLDLLLIEAEQCQTPRLPMFSSGYIDGIRFDENNNILWYDILPEHPGSESYSNMRSLLEPTRVPPSQVMHWWKMKRPGSHRGIPSMTSTLNVGANARRWRESTLAAAESAADFSVLIKTAFQPEEMDSIQPMSTMDIEKRMMVALPEGYDAQQMKAEFPSQNHESFQRGLISEQSRPLSVPYNAAAMDSSTYSFASGKLDTLSFRAELDVERTECSEMVLDRIFAEWFREWVVLNDARRLPEMIKHQWDWPAHPVIDAVAEAEATDSKLKNGTTTLRQVYSDAGRDFEDVLVEMTEDYFGEATDANIASMRERLLDINLPAPQQGGAPGETADEAPAMEEEEADQNEDEEDDETANSEAPGGTGSEDVPASAG